MLPLLENGLLGQYFKRFKSLITAAVAVISAVTIYFIVYNTVFKASLDPGPEESFANDPPPIQAVQVVEEDPVVSMGADTIVEDAEAYLESKISDEVEVPSYIEPVCTIITPEANAMLDKAATSKGCNVKVIDAIDRTYLCNSDSQQCEPLVLLYI